MGPPVVRVWLEHSNATKDGFPSKESLGPGSHLIRRKGRLSLQFREWQAWVYALLLPLAGSEPLKPL